MNEEIFPHSLRGYFYFFHFHDHVIYGLIPYITKDCIYKSNYVKVHLIKKVRFENFY